MTDHEQITHEDDEALSALLDGELPDDEAERLRARLAREPALAARLEVLENADAKVRGAYEGLTDEPVPQSVVDLLRPAEGSHATGSGEAAAPANEARASAGEASASAGEARALAGEAQAAAGEVGASAAETGGDVVDFRARARKRTGEPRRWFSMPAAVAAGIALVVGVLVGRVLGPDAPAPETSALVAGAVEPGTPLHDALQSAPSTETRELSANLSVTPALTFRTQNGNYCRQLDLTTPRGTTETLACRRDEEWRVELAAFTPRPGDGDVYRPAAGDDSPVRAAVDSMIEGAPLDAEAEQSLIARGWEAP